MIEQNEQDEAFRQELRSWLKENLSDAFRSANAKTWREKFDIRRNWQKRCFEGRWVAIGFPEEYGGRGATFNQQLIYNEELALAKAPEMANEIGLNILAPTILSVGTPEQKAKYLKDILSGDKIWCQGFSEPNAGSDVASLQTSAVIDGDEFVINGQKVWTSLGWLADYAVVLCRTDPSVPKHKGLSYIIVDMKSQGVTTKPLVQMTGDPGFAEMFFDNVRAPKENLVGKLNGGWMMAIATLMHERATLSFNFAVNFEMQMGRLVELAKTYKRNGRPAIEDSDIAQRLAQSFADVQLFKVNVTRNIARIQKGTLPGPEGSFFKLQWSEMSHRMSKLAMDIIGENAGLGPESDDAPHNGGWQNSYMFSLGGIIAAGSSEIQKNIISQRFLGLPLLQ
jgi:alkylation response protein AidB-like acyl-CoA dehydrogenase